MPSLNNRQKLVKSNKCLVYDLHSHNIDLLRYRGPTIAIMIGLLCWMLMI